MKRTQRKILALVLVVVMAMSMIPFAALADNDYDYDYYNNDNGAAEAPAAAAQPFIVGPQSMDDFTDADLIPEYLFEAVDTLVALNVLRGTTPTTLGLDTGLNRAQITAFIARIAFGIGATNHLQGMDSETVFVDVPSSHWASGYIHFLYSQGLVAGVGMVDGNRYFHPDAPVSHVAAVTMMLRTLGYGESGNLVGSGWDVNATSLAQQIGIFPPALTVDVNSGANRGFTAQYLFNTLTIPDTVAWNNVLSRYVSWSEGIGMGTQGMAAVRTLGEQVFGLVQNATDADPLGWRVRQWDIRTVGQPTRALTGETFPAYDLIGNIVTDGTATILPHVGANLAHGAHREYFVNGWEYVIAPHVLVPGGTGQTQPRPVGAADGTAVTLSFVNAVGVRVNDLVVRVNSATHEVMFGGADAYTNRLDVLRYLAGFRGVEVARVTYADTIPILAGGFVPGALFEAATRQVTIERYVIIARQGARVTGAVTTAGGNVTIPGLINVVPGAVPNLINHAGPENNETGGVINIFPADRIDAPENLASGNFVLYVIGRDGMAFVEHAESVVGRITAPSVINGVATIAGETRRSSQIGVERSIEMSERFNTFAFRDVDKTAWLDRGGNIFAITPGLGAQENYIAVVEIERVALANQNTAPSNLMPAPTGFNGTHNAAGTFVAPADRDATTTYILRPRVEHVTIGTGVTAHNRTRLRTTAVLLSGGGVQSAHVELSGILSEEQVMDVIGTIHRYSVYGDFRLLASPVPAVIQNANQPERGGLLAGTGSPANHLQNNNTPFRAGTTVFVARDAAGNVTVHRGTTPTYVMFADPHLTSVLRSTDFDRHARFVFLLGGTILAPGWAPLLVMLEMGIGAQSREIYGAFDATTGARITGAMATLANANVQEQLINLYSTTNPAGFRNMIVEVQRGAGNHITNVRIPYAGRTDPGIGVGSLIVGWGGLVSGDGMPGHMEGGHRRPASMAGFAGVAHAPGAAVPTSPVQGDPNTLIWQNRLWMIPNNTTAPRGGQLPYALAPTTMWMGLVNAQGAFTSLFIVPGNTGLSSQLRGVVTPPPPPVLSPAAAQTAFFTERAERTAAEREALILQLTGSANALLNALGNALYAYENATTDPAREAARTAIVNAMNALVYADVEIPAMAGVVPSLRNALEAWHRALYAHPTVAAQAVTAWIALSGAQRTALVAALNTANMTALAAALSSVNVEAPTWAQIEAVRVAAEAIYRGDLAAISTVTLPGALRTHLLAMASATVLTAPALLAAAALVRAFTYAPTNATTAVTLLAAINTAITTPDVVATWAPATAPAENPVITQAGIGTAGSITGTVLLTLGSGEAAETYTVAIPTLTILALPEPPTPQLLFTELGGGAFNVRVTLDDAPMANVMVIFALGGEWSEGGQITPANGIVNLGATGPAGISHVLLVTAAWTGDRAAFWTGIENWDDPTVNANLTFGTVDGKYVITGPFTFVPA